MKKVLIAVFCLIGVIVTFGNHIVKADVNQEEFTFGELVAHVAENDGSAHQGSLATYEFKKGLVSGTLEDFSTITGTVEDPILGVAGTDDVYAENWKIYTLKNAGFIYKVTAKTDVEVEFIKDKPEIGWIADTTLKIYKGDGATEPELISSKSLEGSSTLSDLEFKTTLETGECVYYEFVFQWEGNYRNMEEPPKVRVTKSGFVSSVDVSSDGKISAKNLNLNVALLGGTSYDEFDLANFNVSRGAIGSLSSFDETAISINAANKTAQLGLSIDDAYVDENNIYSSKDKGIAYTIEAKDDITVKLSKATIIGDVKTAKIQVYKNDSLHTEYILSDLESVSDEIQIDKDDSVSYLVVSDSSDHAVINLDIDFTIKKFTGTIGEPHDFTELQEITSVEIVDQLVRLNGNDIEMQDIKLNVLQGRVTGTISKFKYYNFIEESQTNQLTSKEYVFDGKDGAAVETWRMKTTLNSHVIYRFVANKDLKLTISNPAITSGWIDNNGEYFGIYLKAFENTFKIKEEKLTSANLAIDAIGGSVHMRAGDTAYWVFGSDVAEEANLQVIPKITTSPEDFDEVIYVETITLNEETITMWDALTLVLNNDYEDKSFALVDVGFYYGDVYEAMNHFMYHEGDGSGTDKDALWDRATGSEKAGFRRWQVEAVPGSNAIMKIVAKSDMQITIKHTPVWEDAWSIHTGIRYIVGNSEGLLMTQKQIYVEANTKENHFGTTISLRESEILYIEYFAKGQFGSLNFAPNIIANIEQFNENNTTDFTYLKEIKELKNSKTEELENYINTLNEDDYKISSWSTINDYYDAMMVDFRLLTSKEEVEELFTETLAKVKSVLTKEQENAKIENHKEKRHSELVDYAKELGQKNYTKENWDSIQSLIEDFKNQAKNMTLESQIDVLFTRVKTQINNVEVKKGIDSLVWIIAGFAAVGIATGVLFFILKKKK